MPAPKKPHNTGVIYVERLAVGCAEKNPSKRLSKPNNARDDVSLRFA